MRNARVQDVVVCLCLSLSYSPDLLHVAAEVRRVHILIPPFYLYSFCPSLHLPPASSLCCPPLISPWLICFPLVSAPLISFLFLTFSCRVCSLFPPPSSISLQLSSVFSSSRPNLSCHHFTVFLLSFPHSFHLLCWSLPLLFSLLPCHASLPPRYPHLFPSSILSCPLHTVLLSSTPPFSPFLPYTQSPTTFSTTSSCPLLPCPLLPCPLPALLSQLID